MVEVASKPKEEPKLEQNYEAEFRLHAFDMKPMQLKSLLDKHVIGQEDAKRVVSTALCTHYMKVQLEETKTGGKIRTPKSNVLLLGPTGSGKTTILRHAAQYLGMPFTETDASQYTCAGYVGEDTPAIMERLYDDAGKNIALAEIGIVFIDEIDKIRAESSGHGRDISGARVQEELLKMLEGKEISFKESHRKNNSELVIDTKNILFILGGAFDGLDDVVRASIGFGAKPNEEVDMYRALREYGMLDQFIGRIPFITCLEKLTQDELAKIMSMRKSDIRQGKINEFEGFGIKLVFTAEGIEELARKAYKRDLGGRGLKHILDNVLLPFQFTLPSTDIKELIITKELVTDPNNYLQQILKGQIIELSPLKEDPNLYNSISRELRGYDFSRYQRELRIDGVPTRFREAATRYGITKKVLPKEIPEILKDYRTKIKQYKEDFEYDNQKILYISKDVECNLINEALIKGRDIEDILYNRITKFFCSETINKVQTKEIRVTKQVISNPTRYIGELCELHETNNL
jgi:ATP-dependent Clp protease ATP-binding subunit ClpX